MRRLERNKTIFTLSRGATVDTTLGRKNEWEIDSRMLDSQHAEGANNLQRLLKHFLLMFAHFQRLISFRAWCLVSTRNLPLPQVFCSVGAVLEAIFAAFYLPSRLGSQC